MGTITRVSDDQWRRGYPNLLDRRLTLRRAVAVLDRRLAAPVGARCGQVRGYATQGERYEKQRRRQKLVARLRFVEARIAQGRVSVVRGGRRLAQARHHLEQVRLTVDQWRARWRAERLHITADGEADKRHGNETIRVDPDSGLVEIKQHARQRERTAPLRLERSSPPGFRSAWKGAVCSRVPCRRQSSSRVGWCVKPTLTFGFGPDESPTVGRGAIAGRC